MELRAVVDEGEEEERPRAARQALTHRPTPWEQRFDLDRIFAYQTQKMVRVKDSRLGLMNLLIKALVVLYVLVVVFGLEGKHSQKDRGVGTTVVKFNCRLISDEKVYDNADLRFPAIEPGGIFIATKKITQMAQEVDHCEDMDSPPRPCPCEDGETCGPDNHCLQAGWCPSLGDRNADDPPDGSRVERIKGLEESSLQILSGISFPNIGNKFYRTGGSKGAVNPFEDIKLKELFKMIDPPLKLEDVIDTGAVILVSLNWMCNVREECEPEVTVAREDGGRGFVQKRARHRRVQGTRFRDAYYIYGVRILVDSIGMGHHMSLVMIIMQVGSGLALLRTASFITDSLMLSNVYKDPVRRRAYYACKVTETQDYSDLQDRINLIENHREEVSQHQAATTLLGKSTSGASGTGIASGLRTRGGTPQTRAGAEVVFGLGPGGRGGMTSSLLRGRSADMS